MANIEINHHTFSEIMEYVSEVHSIQPDARLVSIDVKHERAILEFSFRYGISTIGMPWDMTIDEREKLVRETWGND